MMTRYVFSSRPGAGRGPVRNAGRVATALMLAVLAGACTPDTAHWTPKASPKEVKVELVPLTHDVMFARSDAALSQADGAVLNDFLARQDVGAGDRLYVIAAGEGAPSLLDRRRAEAVQRHLRRQGYRATLLGTAEWAGAPQGSGVRLLVHRFVSRLPRCPDWRKPAKGDHGNTEASNWGCANAVNLGLMVADPRDLTMGRPEGYSDGTRDAGAVQRYREGQVKALQDTGATQ